MGFFTSSIFARCHHQHGARRRAQGQSYGINNLPRAALATAAAAADRLHGVRLWQQTSCQHVSTYTGGEPLPHDMGPFMQALQNQFSVASCRPRATTRSEHRACRHALRTPPRRHGCACSCPRLPKLAHRPSLPVRLSVRVAREPPPSLCLRLGPGALCERVR